MQRADSVKSTIHPGSLYQGNATPDDDENGMNVASKLFMGMGFHRPSKNFGTDFIEEFRHRLAEEQDDREEKKIGHAVFGAGCE